MKNESDKIQSNIFALKAFRVITIVLTVFSFHVMTLSAKAQSVRTPSQGIVAVVNNDIISQFDLGSRIKFIIFSSRLSSDKKTVQRIAAQVLRGLINDKLKLQEAKRLRVKVSQSEMKAAISKIEKNNKLGIGEMRKFLTKQGIDFRTFELQIEAEVAWRKAVVRQVRSTIKIGEDAIDEAISGIEKNKGKPEYFVAEIFIPFDPTKSAEETFQSTIRLHSQVQKGANFAALARSFSQSASAANGGNLGWIRSDQVDENLSAIIINMPKGATTKPIRGADGFYILRMLNKRRSSGLPTTNVKISLQQVFLPLRQNPSPGEVSAQSSLAKKISSSITTCSALAKKGAELGSKQSGRLEVEDISRLPANLRNVVQNIPLSKASDPIQTAAGFLVLMVCKRSGGGITEDIRNRIRNTLLEKRATLVSRRMLRNIRRTAFVDIRR
jgi:peptidyl-prolyl cis-trans isomerase SurA